MKPTLPPTPRTRHRRHVREEKLAQIFSELKVSPRDYAKSLEGNKIWQIRPNELQSPLVRKLNLSHIQRKKKMRVYSSDEQFKEFFRLEGGDEKRHVHEMSPIASKVEQVAREVIDKTAVFDARIQHGVWSQLGKPYEPLGEPASGIPHSTPIPPLQINLGHEIKEDEPFPFFEYEYIKYGSSFWRPPRQMNRKKNFRLRRQLLLEYLKLGSNMNLAFTKMGLLHLHDIDYAKFPRHLVDELELLKKTVQVGGMFSDEKSATHTTPPPKGLKIDLGGATTTEYQKWDDSSSVRPPSSTAPSTVIGTDDLTCSYRSGAFMMPQTSSTLHSSAAFRGHNPYAKEFSPPPHSAGVSHVSITSRPISSPPLTVNTSIDVEPIQLTQEEIPVGKKVFEWKKHFLLLRRNLHENLEAKVHARVDRRERCRTSSPLPAEVADMLMSYLQNGRTTPMFTTQLWKQAQQKVPPRAASASLYPQLELINKFYKKVCAYVHNQKTADPLMDMIVHELKRLLESGSKLNKELMMSVCHHLATLPNDTLTLGKLSTVLPILQFMRKTLHITGNEYLGILKHSGLDRAVLAEQRHSVLDVR